MAAYPFELAGKLLIHLNYLRFDSTLYCKVLKFYLSLQP